VRVVTSMWAGRPSSSGSITDRDSRFFLFSNMSRAALGLIECHVEWK
jgi:hypothetical protein